MVRCCKLLAQHQVTWCREWVSKISHLNMPPVACTPVNYYSILGIPASADIATINAAFRRLARHYHPDRNPALDATVQFQKISEARHVLSDPFRRARYDCICHLQSGGESQATGIPSPSRQRREKRRRRPIRTVTLTLALGLLIPTFWAALLVSLMRLHSGSSTLDSMPEPNGVSSNCAVSPKTFPAIGDSSYGDVAMTWDAAGHSCLRCSTCIFDVPDQRRSLPSTVIDVYADYHAGSDTPYFYRVEY
jgi:hypothetical protein